MPAERTGAVAGVLLAGGPSSRMGTNKLLLDIDGETLVRGAVRRAIAAGLNPVIVVLGHEAERIERELDGLGPVCRTVVNADYARGINSSLKTGIAALPTTVDAVVVMLADMPFVTSEMIASLIERYRARGRTPLVISDYEGVNAPPMLYDRALFPELQTMEGEGCGKVVVRRHRSEAEVLAWPATALADLDVPADYNQFTSRRTSHTIASFR
ncbi:MAG: nucleotidyltransferase family protein [Gemmatimonadaceae bacterium]